MKFILVLLLIFFSLNYSRAQESSSSITVENYFCFLTDPASLPEADQIYDSATMQDQIQQTKEGDQITYHIVDGQSDQPMSGLTDLEVELYSHWVEVCDSTSTPLMMFGSEKKEDQRKKAIELSEAQRQRQRNTTSGPTDSTPSSARGSSIPKISERTPLLSKGNSSTSQIYTASSRWAPIVSAPQVRIISPKNKANERIDRSLGTREERQALLGSNHRSSTTRPGEPVRPGNPASQRTRTPLATALLAQSESTSTRPITRIEDVHQIDDLINTTHYTTSAKEKEQPNFDGIAPASLFFPQRIATYLFSESLGRKLAKDFSNVRKEQAQIQRTTPLLRPPTDDSQIPKFLEQTERWIEAQKEITELSVHFLNRVIHVQDNKTAQVNALSPHFFTAVKNVWINEVNNLLETHKKVMAAEALSSKVEKLSHSSFLTNSIEKMRKTSNYAVEQFLRKGEGYIYLCEKQFFNKTNDRNCRLNLLQLSLTMKEQLEGLRKIALANDQLYLAKTAIFTPFGESPVAFIDPSRKQELIRAAEQARNEAYRSYQPPVFNRQQELVHAQQANHSISIDDALECLGLLLEIVAAFN